MSVQNNPQVFFRNAGLRFASYYKSLAEENKAVNDTLQEELENLLSSLNIYKQQRDWAEASSLIHALDIFLDGQGYWDVLNYWLENVINHLRHTDKDNHLTENTLSLAHLYSNQGKRKKSIETYRRGIKLAEVQNDSQNLAQAYYGLGTVFFATGEVKRARENWQTALKYANECADDIQIAIIKYNLTLLDNNTEGELSVGHLQNATEFAAGMFSKLGQEGIALNTMLRASTLLQTGKYDEAQDLFLDALKQFKNGNEKQGEALVLYNLGLISQHKGDFSTALQYFQKSLVIADSLKDRTGLILLNSSVGMLHLQSQRYDLARPFLEETNKLLREDGDGKRLADNQYWLGYAFANTGNLELAEQAFEESRVLFSKIEPTKVKNVDEVLLKVRELIHKQAD